MTGKNPVWNLKGMISWWSQLPAGLVGNIRKKALTLLQEIIVHNANKEKLAQIVVDSKKLLNCFNQSGSHTCKVLQATTRNKKMNTGKVGTTFPFLPLFLAGWLASWVLAQPWEGHRPQWEHLSTHRCKFASVFFMFPAFIQTSGLCFIKQDWISSVLKHYFPQIYFEVRCCSIKVLYEVMLSGRSSVGWREGGLWDAPALVSLMQRFS